MIHTGYLPPKPELYVSKCHLEVVKETLKGIYRCSECRKELNRETIIHLYKEFPNI